MLLDYGISLKLTKITLALGGSGRNAEERGKKRKDTTTNVRKFRVMLQDPLRLQFLYLWESATEDESKK